MEFTEGRPVPVWCGDHQYFVTAMVNDTAFLSVIKIIDYSILVSPRGGRWLGDYAITGWELRDRLQWECPCLVPMRSDL
jgi:hypothetical protein